MACFRQVRARRFPGPGGAAGLLEARRCRGARAGLSLSLPLPAGLHAAPADQHPLLPGGHRRLLRLRQLRLDQRRDTVGQPHPGPRGPLRAGRQEPAGGPPPKEGKRRSPAEGEGGRGRAGAPRGASSPPPRGLLCGGAVGEGSPGGASRVGVTAPDPLLPQDMNRAVVKTDAATAAVPELDFEIPAFSQKGGGYEALLGPLGEGQGHGFPGGGDALRRKRRSCLWWILAPQLAYFWAEEGSVGSFPSWLPFCPGAQLLPSAVIFPGRLELGHKVGGTRLGVRQG